MADCPVCCDAFNKSTRLLIECECSDCQFAACKTCIRAYLLSQTSDPACMSCHKAWSQGFLTRSLNTSFMTKEYRAHRSRVLKEREQARLQDSVQDAARQVEADALTEELVQHDTLIGRLSAELEWAKRKRTNTSNRRYALQHGMDVEGAEKEEKREFIMPCPAPDCRGFLSTQWKCGLCDVYACKDCLEVIGFDKQAPHTCKPDNVASATAIRKETKPCPACGVRIQKAHGCDQMWCTLCHVTFSYRTGKRTNGMVHNPHYLEWQRASKDGDGAAVRAPGDVHCGGLPAYYDMHYVVCDKIRSVEDWVCFKNSTAAEDVRKATAGKEILGFSPKLLQIAVLQLYRIANDITRTTLPRMREQMQRLDDFGPTRVQYLLKRIGDADFEKQVFAQDAKRRKTLQVLHVIELLGVVMTETFNEMVHYCQHGVDSPTQSAEHTLQDRERISKELSQRCGLSLDPRQGKACNLNAYTCTIAMVTSVTKLDRLLEYCNSQLAQISVAFSLSVPSFETGLEKWKWSKTMIVYEARLAPRTEDVFRGRNREHAVHFNLYTSGTHKYGKAEANALDKGNEEQPTENVKV